MAETYFLRQLKITRRLAPGSLDLAANLNKLGDTASQRGKLRDAEDQYQEAWKIVKRQAQQVTGDSGRQAFGRMNHYYAADLVSIQLKRLEADAAFVTMEEGRAQALLQAIAEKGGLQKRRRHRRYGARTEQQLVRILQPTKMQSAPPHT